VKADGRVFNLCNVYANVFQSVGRDPLVGHGK
jgi:hypothetical protein